MTMDATLFYLLFIVILPTTGILCAAANLVSTVYVLINWESYIPNITDRLIVTSRTISATYISLAALTVKLHDVKFPEAKIWIFVLAFFIPVVFTAMNVRDFRNLWNWRKKN